MGTGRGGSTTVQEMMGSVPGFYIAGENAGLMNKQLDMFQILRAADGHGGSSSWAHAPVSQHGMFCAVQHYIKEAIGAAAFPATHTIGFKEIRWGEDAKLADFMLKVFPCARFIVNTRRDLDRQLASQHHAFHGQPDAKRLEKVTRMLEKWQSNHHLHASVIHLEDFSLERFNQLLQWLNVTDCRFKSVAHANPGGYSRP
eukprot:UN3220